MEVPSQEDPGLQRLAVNAYVALHPEVTPREAERRLELQDRAARAGVSEVLPDLIGEAYAGAWYSADDGGRLVIGVKTSEPSPSGPEVDRAGAMLSRAGLAADVVFRSTGATLAELDAALEQLRTELDDLLGASQITLGIVPQHNAVHVGVGERVEPAVRSRLDAAVGRLPPAVGVRIEPGNVGATKR